MSMHISVQKTLIIVGGIIILALIGYSLLAPRDVITATGQSSIEVLPDYTVVYFNVETYGKTSAEAQESNENITSALTNSLFSLGFEQNEIKTTGYSIYPEYSWGEYNKREIERYVASHSIKISIPIEENEGLSEVINAGVNSGAGISYINFELSSEHESEYKAEAIKKATEDARVKARALADGARKKLGSLTSISNSDFGYSPWIAYDSASGMEARTEAVSISPSEQTISAYVTASFRIR